MTTENIQKFIFITAAGKQISIGAATYEDALAVLKIDHLALWNSIHGIKDKTSLQDKHEQVTQVLFGSADQYLGKYKLFDGYSIVSGGNPLDEKVEKMLEMTINRRNDIEEEKTTVFNHFKPTSIQNVSRASSSNDVTTIDAKGSGDGLAIAPYNFRYNSNWENTAQQEAIPLLHVTGNQVEQFSEYLMVMEKVKNVLTEKIKEIIDPTITRNGLLGYINELFTTDSNIKRFISSGTIRDVFESDKTEMLDWVKLIPEEEREAKADLSGIIETSSLYSTDQYLVHKPSNKNSGYRIDLNPEGLTPLSSFPEYVMSPNFNTQLVFNAIIQKILFEELGQDEMLINLADKYGVSDITIDIQSIDLPGFPQKLKTALQHLKAQYSSLNLSPNLGRLVLKELGKLKFGKFLGNEKDEIEDILNTENSDLSEQDILYDAIIGKSIRYYAKNKNASEIFSISAGYGDNTDKVIAKSIIEEQGLEEFVTEELMESSKAKIRKYLKPSFRASAPYVSTISVGSGSLREDSDYEIEMTVHKGNTFNASSLCGVKNIYITPDGFYSGNIKEGDVTANPDVMLPKYGLLSGKVKYSIQGVSEIKQDWKETEERIKAKFDDITPLSHIKYFGSTFDPIFITQNSAIAKNVKGINNLNVRFFDFEKAIFAEAKQSGEDKYLTPHRFINTSMHFRLDLSDPLKVVRDAYAYDSMSFESFKLGNGSSKKENAELFGILGGLSIESEEGRIENFEMPYSFRYGISTNTAHDKLVMFKADEEKGTGVKIVAKGEDIANEIPNITRILNDTETYFPMIKENIEKLKTIATDIHLISDFIEEGINDFTTAGTKDRIIANMRSKQEMLDQQKLAIEQEIEKYENSESATENKAEAIKAKLFAEINVGKDFNNSDIY